MSHDGQGGGIGEFRSSEPPHILSSIKPVNENLKNRWRRMATVLWRIQLFPTATFDIQLTNLLAKGETTDEG